MAKIVAKKCEKCKEGSDKKHPRPPIKIRGTGITMTTSDQESQVQRVIVLHLLRPYRLQWYYRPLQWFQPLQWLQWFRLFLIWALTVLDVILHEVSFLWY